MLRIMADSGCDITQKEAEKMGIKVIPLIFRFGKEEFLDGIEISNHEFFRRLEESNELPTTSQIPPIRYQEIFEEELESADEIIYISVYSGLSGCYRNACLAAKELGDRVKVIDGRNACISLRILVEYAARLAKEGKSSDEIIELFTEAQKKVRLIAILDNLDNLLKGGRISQGEAVVANVLSIKPLVTIIDGEIKAIGKVHGMKKGMKAMREYIEKESGIDLTMPYCVAFSGTNDSRIREFYNENRDLYENAQLSEFTNIGAIVGTYAGSGAIGTAYFIK